MSNLLAPTYDERLPASIQPVRWPAHPAAARIILGKMAGPYSRETYCHLGPLVVSIEDDGRSLKFAIHVFRRRWQFAVKFRVRRGSVP